MFARVTIHAGPPQKSVVVPETALAQAGDGEGSVFTLRGNQLSLRRLALGRKLGEEREVLSGLDAGEAVVLRPDPLLKDGEYVQPLL
jgi:multidrug efflux pump subunit AcrA (membrane-fusion protein)